MTTTATRPAGAKPRAASEAKTLRTDRWWLAPLLTGTGGRAVAELGGGVRLSYAVEPHSGLVLLHAVG